MAKDRQIARKGFLVRNRSFDSDLLDMLAQDSHPRVQQLVALHPNTMEKTLVRLANNPEIGIFILRNPNLTEEIFEQLVSSNNPKLNFALAQHSRTSRETLENIAAKSEDAATLIAVVENNQTGKKTKSEILTRLAGFSSRSVRQYVAQNSCTPENILWGWGTSQRYYNIKLMTIPKNRRGFRSIVVDSINYDWRFYTYNCSNESTCYVDIRLTTTPRSKLLIDIDWEDPCLTMRENYHHHHLHPCSSPITPKFVANAIKASVKLGWQAQEDYGEFYVKYQSGEFSIGKIISS